MIKTICTRTSQSLEWLGGKYTVRLILDNPVINSLMVNIDGEDIIVTEESSLMHCLECDFVERPTIAEIKKVFFEYFNDLCSEEILTGLSFEGSLVWLTLENQLNYKTAYDIAQQTDGLNLPVTFKLGTDEFPVYRQFTTVDDLREFILLQNTFISDTLNKYWQLKDSIDWSSFD